MKCLESPQISCYTPSSLIKSLLHFSPSSKKRVHALLRNEEDLAIVLG